MKNINIQKPETNSFVEELEITTPLSESRSTDKKNAVILDKIIKWCIYILVALIPLWFLPFTRNVLDLNKQVLMIGLLTVALIAWLIKILAQEKIRWNKGLTVFLFLAFLIVYSVATGFSMRPYDSLIGSDANLNRALINIIYFFIFFLILLNYKEDETEEYINNKTSWFFKLVTILLVSSTIAAIIGLFQILGKFIFPWDFTKVNSFNTIGTLTSLGIFLAALLPLALSLLLTTKKQTKEKKSITTGFRAFLVIFVVLSLIIILLINIKTLWIITAVGAIAIILIWLIKRSTSVVSSPSWVAVPVTILALCLIFIFFRPGINFNLDLPSEVGLSLRGGVNITKEIIQRNPILGTGPETFIYNYSLFKPQSVNNTIFWNLRFANAPSEILSILSEIGILGILVFLSMLGVFCFTVIKDLFNKEKNSTELSGIKIGLMSGWLVLAVSWFLYPQNMTLMFVFWLLFTILIAISSEKKDVKIIDLKSSNKIASIISFGFIILIIAVIGLLYLGASKFVAEAKYKSGITALQDGRIEFGISKIIKATVINSYEDKFYRDLAQLFLIQINQDLNDSSLDPQEQARRVQVGISNAINSAVRATTLNPDDVTNWIIRGSSYRNLMSLVDGAGGWAIGSYEQALIIEPANPFIYAEIARTYIAGFDILKEQAQENPEIQEQIMEYLDKAIENYVKAAELKPDYSPVLFEIAQVYDRQGRVDYAIAQMEINRQLSPEDTNISFQLAVLYYRTSQFEKAKAEFARAIILDPNFSNARFLLGLLLDREDRKDLAIGQFEKIAEINPNNDLVKQILANLRAGLPALGSAELGPPDQPENIPIRTRQPEEL